MSKGSKQRPTDMDAFRSNYDLIFRKDKRVEEDAMNEDEEFKLIEEKNKDKIKEDK